MKEIADQAPLPDTKQFPCKQCGAKLDFAPGTAALQCPYCGSETAIPQSEEQICEVDFRAYLAQASERQEEQAEQHVKCEACGAETTLPPETAAGNGPFCGANLVIAASTSR